MKIKRIKIKDFILKGNMLNIKLNRRGLLVTGLNGAGKTVLLNFINALYTKDVSTLIQLPFSEAEVILGNGEKFLVEKKLKYTSELFEKLSGTKVIFFEEDFKFQWLSQEKLRKLPNKVVEKYLAKTKKALKGGETVFENSNGSFRRYDELSNGETKIIRYLVASIVEKYDIIIMDLPENGISLSAQSKLVDDLYYGEKFPQLIVSTHAPYIFDDLKNQEIKILNLNNKN